MADLLSAAMQAGYMRAGDYSQDSESSVDDSKFSRRAGGGADAEEGQGYGAHRERQAIHGISGALVRCGDYAIEGGVGALTAGRGDVGGCVRIGCGLDRCDRGAGACAFDDLDLL